MDSTVFAVFGFVYLGMFLGEISGLALDRTGVALLGAIVLLATEKVTPEAAWQAVDVPTIALLFGLMVVSAQFRLGGFYANVTRWMADAKLSPDVLLTMVVSAAGVLSALLANDIVCLATAPVLAEGCCRQKLDPMPFLLALACSANIGSAATLIGNPQNMLIGQKLICRSRPICSTPLSHRSWDSRWCGASCDGRRTGSGTKRHPFRTFYPRR